MIFIEMSRFLESFVQDGTQTVDFFDLLGIESYNSGRNIRGSFFIENTSL